MPALALCMCSPPAMAAGVLFTDLGPAGNVYDRDHGWAVTGTDYCLSPGCFTSAQLFTVSGIGSVPVTGIDLAVDNAYGANSFYASIWTDSSSLPGAQVADAYWTLSTSTPSGSCCDFVSITDIAGVTLTGGQQYFMILGPLSASTYDSWQDNNQGVSGLDLWSDNGGATWHSSGAQTLGAFDINGTPEPGSLLLFGTGLISILGVYRRKANL
jgi:hypothetical protein